MILNILLALTLVDDHFFQPPLGSSPLHDALVYGVCSDQAIHHYGVGLTNPVTAILSLQVRLGVLGEERLSELPLCRQAETPKTELVLWRQAKYSELQKSLQH